VEEEVERDGRGNERKKKKKTRGWRRLLIFFNIAIISV
jgi:hypothetical protein